MCTPAFQAPTIGARDHPFWTFDLEVRSKLFPVNPPVTLPRAGVATRASNSSLEKNSSKKRVFNRVWLTRR